MRAARAADYFPLLTNKIIVLWCCRCRHRFLNLHYACAHALVFLTTTPRSQARFNEVIR